MKIKLGTEEIHLDPALLKFDEVNINEFLQNFAGHYNYFQTQHANAQYINGMMEDKYEAVHSDKFRNYKMEKVSDKMAEAQAATDPAVIEAAEHARESKRIASLLYGYLRSMDRAHDMCLQSCYNLRKEMGMIFKDNVKKLPYEL